LRWTLHKFVLHNDIRFTEKKVAENTCSIMTEGYLFVTRNTTSAYTDT
jgi:hypothetical protein